MLNNPLGQQTEYVSQYAPSLLFPIPRNASREPLGLSGSLPFHGVDVWTGYELSWLAPSGKPVVAVAEFRVPCESPCIIESKSFKLYLNSLNQTVFADIDAVKAVLVRDLSAAAGSMVDVILASLAHSQSFQTTEELAATVLDELDVNVVHYHPAPQLLRVGDSVVEEQVVSHLLKSNCPVTGQPDWASVFIRYRGKQIDHKGLLAYVISFREHQDFHENCVERIFCDINTQCKPERLSVYARYTRRGGLDINPFRSNFDNDVAVSHRLVRQ